MLKTAQAKGSIKKLPDIHIPENERHTLINV